MVPSLALEKMEIQAPPESSPLLTLSYHHGWRVTAEAAGVSPSWRMVWVATARANPGDRSRAHPLKASRKQRCRIVGKAYSPARPLARPGGGANCGSPAPAPGTGAIPGHGLPGALLFQDAITSGRCLGNGPPGRRRPVETLDTI